MIVSSTEYLTVVQKCHFEEYNTLYPIAEYSETKSYSKDSNIIWSSVTDWLPQSGSSAGRQSPVSCCGRSEITRIKRQMLFFGLSLILPLLILAFGKEIHFDLLSCYPQQMQYIHYFSDVSFKCVMSLYKKNPKQTVESSRTNVLNCRQPSII